MIRQLLTESILLSLLGGAAGLLLARWAIAGLNRLALLDLPGVGDIRLDATVCGFALVVSIGTGILFGVAPSFQVSRRDLVSRLRETGAAAGQSGLQRRSLIAASLRGIMVTAQVAMSIVLLVGATLLLKSFMRLQEVDPGFQPTNILTAKISLAPTRYDEALKRIMFSDELVSRIESLPGVRSAALALSLPSTTWYRTNIQLEGKTWDADPGNWPSIQIQSVTSSYFQTLGIPLKRGRQFTELDSKLGAPPPSLSTKASRAISGQLTRPEKVLSEHI